MAGPWQPGEFDSGKLELLCSMLSVMCSQERLRVCGGEQARLLPARCRPSGPTHKGEGHVKRHVEKKEKERRRQEQVSKLEEGSFFFGLVSPSPSPAFAFAVENLSCHTAPISLGSLSFSLSFFLTPLC